MDDAIYWLIFVVGWVALQGYILPKLGIPTCMSGSCAVPVNKKRSTEE